MMIIAHINEYIFVHTTNRIIVPVILEPSMSYLWELSLSVSNLLMRQVSWIDSIVNIVSACTSFGWYIKSVVKLKSVCNFLNWVCAHSRPETSCGCIPACFLKLVWSKLCACFTSVSVHTPTFQTNFEISLHWENKDCGLGTMSTGRRCSQSLQLCCIRHLKIHSRPFILAYLFDQIVW